MANKLPVEEDTAVATLDPFLQKLHDEVHFVTDHTTTSCSGSDVGEKQVVLWNSRKKKKRHVWKQSLVSSEVRQTECGDSQGSDNRNPPNRNERNVISSLEQPITLNNIIPDKKPLNLLLLGRTGSGKSMLGNTILQTTGLFRSSGQSATVTHSVTSHSRLVGGQRVVTVADTPGLDGSTQALEEITAAVLNSLEGYDAFLLVVRYPTRITSEDYDLIHTLKSLLGAEFGRQVIVVFTGGDTFHKEQQLYTSPQSFHSFIEGERLSNNRNSFGAILRELTGGWILMDNFESGSLMQTRQLNELFSLVDSLRDDKGIGRYTSSHLTRAVRQVSKHHQTNRYTYRKKYLAWFLGMNNLCRLKNLHSTIGNVLFGDE